MTERLFYQDPYRRQFEARIVERLRVGHRPGVVLDRTCFYPTSGGQPHDTGTLEGIPVVDVFEREEDKAIVHVLASELEGETVRGEIHWARRFDHMQQHTGQHILSQAFLQVLGAETVSFHLGAEASTIDVDRAPLTAAQLDEVEARANEVVFADRSVRTYFVGQEELTRLPLRKPPVVTGPIRIVEIEDFDYSPCGGTHCRRTGEVGLIKITRAERRRQETRVEFLCGWRALADYRRKNRTVNELAQRFSVGTWELREAVERLAAEAKACRRELKAARERLLDYEAAELWAEAERCGDFRLVKRAFAGRSGDEVKRLAMRLAEREGCVALLGLREEGKARLFFARSADLACDMGVLIGEACRIVGGRGGGRPHLAQGGGPDAARIEEALDCAYRSLVAGME